MPALRKLSVGSICAYSESFFKWALSDRNTSVELLAMCDRIGVMSRGRLREVRQRNEWTEETIMACAVAIDDVIKSTGIATGRVQTLLLELDLEGRIEWSSGQLVALKG